MSRHRRYSLISSDLKAERCADCGKPMLYDLEPFQEDEFGCGTSLELSHWCSDLSCPSNSAVDGLLRVGVNEYRCLGCGARLRTPMTRVVAHLRDCRLRTD